MTFDLTDPIPWEAVEDALVAWVSAVLDINLQLLWENGPQESRPFATIGISGPFHLSIVDERRFEEKLDSGGNPTDTYQNKVVGQREIVVSVQIEVDKADGRNASRHARAMATRLQSSLELDVISEPLEAVGLAMREKMPVQDISLTIANVQVSRSLTEYRFGIASVVAEDKEIVERVTGTGTVAGGADGSSKTVGIDIDSTP